VNLTIMRNQRLEYCENTQRPIAFDRVVNKSKNNNKQQTSTPNTF